MGAKKALPNPHCIFEGVSIELFDGSHIVCPAWAQDAYMPKDASKLGHRGIGFVTFASPDAVEMVR